MRTEFLGKKQAQVVREIMARSPELFQGSCWVELSSLSDRVEVMVDGRLSLSEIRLLEIIMNAISEIPYAEE